MAASTRWARRRAPLVSPPAGAGRGAGRAGALRYQPVAYDLDALPPDLASLAVELDDEWSDEAWARRPPCAPA